MMVRICVFAFLIIFLSVLVSARSNCTRTKACEAVFSPDAMKISCCPPIDQAVEVITKCQKKSSNDVFTCSESQCLVDEYGIMTNNKIDESKIRAVIKKLIKEDPGAKSVNDEVLKNCLNGQYKKYVTSDPECDTMKYEVCAYVNYLMGCQKFNKSPRRCKTLAKNVKTCKPFLQQYLKQINS